MSLNLDDLFCDADGRRLPAVSIAQAAEYLSEQLDYDVSPFVIRSIVRENGLGVRIGNALALGPEDVEQIADELDGDLEDDEDDEEDDEDEPDADDNDEQDDDEE